MNHSNRPNPNHHTGKSGLALLASIKISKKDKIAWVAVFVAGAILIAGLIIRFGGE